MGFSFSLVILVSPITSLLLSFNGVRSEFVALKSLNFHSFFLQNFPNKRMAVFCSPKTKELKKGSFAFLLFVCALARICCVCAFWLRCGTTFHLNELLIFLFVILNYSKFVISKYLSKRLCSSIGASTDGTKWKITHKLRTVAVEVLATHRHMMDADKQ